MTFFGGHGRDKGFSSKNQVQRYHGDGSESIIVMGRPFRVLQKISDVPPPYMVGRTRKIKYGEGGSSYVYLVENSSRLAEFPRHVALKRSFFGVDQVAEAHKEIDIFTRVKDKNIVRVYHSEISRNEGKLGVSIAMEYCSNNLYRRIRSSAGTGAGTRLSEGEICHVLLALTSAVGYLHTQQPPIAHRDIRPENILINNNVAGPLAYKLTNFTSAATEAYHCDTREEANMAIADIQIHTNPAFRAPEAADPWGKKRISEKVDLWSIGVLLYYMMYLKLPFDPANVVTEKSWAVKYPPQRGTTYSGSLRVAVEHLLDPNPDSRWDIFALTNFLRFDEDVSRHLGTFCFSKTEWPEGWEDQDIKVLNRAQPAKAPPVSYGEPGHETLDSKRGASSSHGSPRPAPSATATATGTSSAVPPSAMGGGDALQDALMVLGGDPADDDPEMAQYRAMIIKEQEEAWERAKAAAGGGASRPAGATSSPAPATAAAANEEAKAVEAKKDVFDDLFAGPAQPASPPPVAASEPSPTSSAPPQQSPPPPAKDMFSTDDLFSAPPQQQQQQQFPPMMGGAVGGGWDTGAPAMMMGGAPAPGGYNNNQNNNFAPPPQQQQQQYGAYPTAMDTMNTGYAAPPPQPQQQYGGYNNNNNNYNNNFNNNNFGMAPPPQQVVDFTAPVPGQQATVKPPEPTPAPKQAPKKDPFADLFN